MADRDIIITLKTELESLEKQKDNIIKKSEATPKEVLGVKKAVQQIRTLLETLNPNSNKSLSSVNAAFNTLFDTLYKLADRISTVSPAFKKLTEQLGKTREQIDTKLSERSAIIKSKYDKDKGVLYDHYKNEQLKKEGIRYKIGKNQAANFDTLQKNITKVQSNEKTSTQVFATEKDYTRALDFVAKLNKETQAVAQSVANLDEEIEKLEDTASEQAQNLQKEAEKASPEIAELTKTQTNTQTAIGEQKQYNIEQKDTFNTQENRAKGALEGLDATAIDKQSTSLGKAFKQFSIYAIAVRTARKALTEATKTIKEIDKALTEQAMVVGLTREQAYGLLSTYQDMSARLGATTKEISSTMTEFLRQGRSINDSLKLTEAAVSAAKVASISTADSINYLTTAINGFSLSAEDAMSVSDKFAAIAAASASSYEEIAVALSKVAAQANLAEMSIDYTTALLTKGIETTREAPETIGTALKTIIARMRELGDYGETLDGDTDLNNVETQLSYIGIALRDTNGELRSTELVLNELGVKWDTLNANQQAAIAKALAGTRQQSRLIAMMNDYERVIELQNISEQSSGATMSQMASYMEGMEAALNKVSVAWEKLVSTISDSNIIIGLVNGVS